MVILAEIHHRKSLALFCGMAKLTQMWDVFRLHEKNPHIKKYSRIESEDNGMER